MKNTYTVFQPSFASKAKVMANLWFILTAFFFLTYTGPLLAHGLAHVVPGQSRTVTLDVADIAAQLLLAPKEGNAKASNKAIYVSLPLPEGQNVQVRVWEVPVLSEDYSMQLPTIKTFAFQSEEDAHIHGRLTLSPYGLRGGIFTPHGLAMLNREDLTKSNSAYTIGYDKETSGANASFELPDEMILDESPMNEAILKSNINEDALIRFGGTLKKFRLALVATERFLSENTEGLSGVEAKMAAMELMTHTISMVNATFEREVGIRLELVAPEPDPLANIFEENPAPITNFSTVANAGAFYVKEVFPIDAYDIGHAFNNHKFLNSGPVQVGGAALVSSVCFDGMETDFPSKAKAWSGWYENTSPYWIKIATHEFGHQFGAVHTHNSNGGTCLSTHDLNNAYEIGSGSTIMSYQGVCSPQNIPSYSEDNNYFHINSILLMRAFVDNPAVFCEEDIELENTAPEVNTDRCNGTYTLPIGTPFTLHGQGFDADGDPLTYTWEQYDEDGPEERPTFGMLGEAAANNPLAPLFRSYPPSSSASRTIPAMKHILFDDNFAQYEALPQVGREINMILTARDNNSNGGGVATALTKINVDGTKGPLVVKEVAVAPSDTNPNEANFSVELEVNNVNFISPTVSVFLSLDDGRTFPISLSSISNPNTGEIPLSNGMFFQSVPIPYRTRNARIKVVAKIDDCFEFFDISAPFSIATDCRAPASTIYPDDAVSVQDNTDEVLNFTFNNAAAIPISSYNFKPRSLAPGKMNILRWNDVLDGPNCIGSISPGAMKDYKVFRFTVDQTGYYSFRFEDEEGNPKFSSVHLVTADYEPDSDCMLSSICDCPDFLASSLISFRLPNGNASIAPFNDEVLNTPLLQAGQEYRLLATDELSLPLIALGASYVKGTDVTVNFDGPGNVISPDGLNLFDNSYTYVAVNTSTNEIVAVSDDANFIGQLDPGNVYNIHGLSYNEEDVNVPDDLLNLNVQNLDGNPCVVPSTNFTSLTIAPNIGSLVITEILNNPSAGGEQDLEAEWFELHNPPGNSTINLKGLIVKDDDLDQFEITSDVLVPSGGYVVLGNNAEAAGIPLDYEYDGFTLGNGADEIVILSGTTEIDRVNYNGTFPNVNGVSMNLNPDPALNVFNATGNDLGTNWCAATSFFGSGTDKGTPGAVNDACGPIATPATVSIEAVDAVKAEGNSGTTIFSFKIVRAGNLETTFAVSYSVSGEGTNAADADDFEGGFPMNTLVFMPNEAEKEVLVSVNGDTDFEADEQFKARISLPNNDAEIGTAEAFGIIENDDEAPSTCPQAGDLVITEVMYNPDASFDNNGEWFEIYNTTETAIDLEGIIIRDDGGESHTISTSVIVPAEGYIVLARNMNSMLNGGVTAQYEYGDEFVLGNSGDEIILICVDETIDRIAYNGTDFTACAGFSLSLDPESISAVANDQPENWCIVSETFGDGDRGSPGSANPACSSVGLLEFSPGTVSIEEGNEGTTDFEFTILRTGDNSEAASATYTVSGSGTNQADAADFGGTFPSGTVSFAAGEGQQTITIQISGDIDIEPNESFTVTLDNASGVFICDATTNGSIVNDDENTCAEIGSLVISEILPNPSAVSDDFGEWFELYNPTDEAINLNGFTISDDGADTHTIEENVIVPAGGYIVLGRSADMDINGGVAVDYEYANFILANSSDEIVISCEGVEIDRVDYNSDNGFFNPVSGESTTLNPNNLNASDNNIGGFWCRASSLFNGTDLGTPGMANDACSNDQVQLAISATEADQLEGNTSNTVFFFTVERTGAIGIPLEIDYSIMGTGAAPADAADFESELTGNLFFLANETSKLVSVTILGDLVAEPDETFTISLINPAANIELVSPSAEGIIRNDDIDSGCIEAGDLIITEIMQNPVAVVDPNGEWFELYNNTDQEIDLNGLILEDEGTDSHTITESVILPAGAYIVLGNNSDMTTNGGIPVAYEYDGSTFVLDDMNPDQIIIRCEGIEIDRVAYDIGVTFPDPFGASMNLNPDSQDATANDFGVNWCLSTTEFAVATLATPAAPNDPCVSSPINLSIEATDAVKAEGDEGLTAFTFTVNRLGNTLIATSVDYEVIPNGVNAADAADFEGDDFPNGTVVFAANQSMQTITVNVLGDTDNETDETFAVTISNPSNDAIIVESVANGVIQNDDGTPPTVTLEATDATLEEGDQGTTNFTFTVIRAENLDVAFTLDYAVSGFGVNSTSADDFVSGIPFGTISLEAGESSAIITIPVQGDEEIEEDETFLLNLLNPSDTVQFVNASANGTILNDDLPPPVVVNIEALDANKEEGDQGTTNFLFTVSRTGDVSEVVSVDYDVSSLGGNGATASDFVGGLPSGTLTFDVSESSITLLIPVRGDVAIEQTEDFRVSLSNPSNDALLGTTTVDGQIINDDFAFQAIGVFPENANQFEGNAGLTPFTFNVLRSGPIDAPVSVNYGVQGINANPANAADFGGVFPAGTLFFPANESAQTLTIFVQGDAVLEADERFTVQLSNASDGSALLNGEGIGIIRNDDQQVGPPTGELPQLSIQASDGVRLEGDFGVTSFTFLALRSGDVTQASSFSYTVVGSGLNPANAADFGGTFPSGTFTLEAGELARTLIIPVSGDLTTEENEQFRVLISNPVNGEIVVANNFAPGDYSKR